MSNQKLIEDVLRKTNREGIEELIAFLAQTDFYEAPASCEFYNSEKGGLSTHVINVYKNLYAKYQSNTKLGEALKTHSGITPASLVLTALLHDVFKANHFSSYVKNVKVYETADSLTPPRDVKTDELGNYHWESQLMYTVQDDYPLKGGEKSLAIVLSYIKLSKEEIAAIRFAGGEYGENANTFFTACNDNPLLIALYESKLEAMFINAK